MGTVQIANPDLVQKIQWLSTSMKLGKTAVVQRAIDAMSDRWQAAETTPLSKASEQRMALLLAQMDRIPEQRANAALEWDENGLPV
jgi:hypothetical protein